MPGSDRWLVVQVRSDTETSSALLSEGLIAAGGSAVEEDGHWLRTYLPANDPEPLVNELRTRLEAAVGGPLELRWEWRPDEDWLRLWRQGLGPRRIGRRIIVAPSWAVPESGSDDVLVVIDPQMAFGTGEHASTRGVLRLLEDVIRPDAAVLDVGTGSGVLAIAAVKLGAAGVLAVDNDEDALVNAAENVVRNGCVPAITLVQAAVSAAYLAAHASRYDVIVGNVLSRVLAPLLPAFRTALRPAGTLLLGGILEPERDDIVGAARAAGLRLVEEDREDEWWSGRFEPSTSQA